MHVSSPPVFVLYNPRSKKNRSDPELASRLREVVGKRTPVRGPQTLEELDELAVELREARPEVLAICGGDGTYHRVVTALVKAYQGDALPQLALLRGGTMNTIPNGLGLPRRRSEQLLRRVIESRDSLKVERRAVLRVGERYGFLFGTGAVYGFLAEYYRSKNPNALIAARTLAMGSVSAFWGGSAIKRIHDPFVGSVELPGGVVWEERPYLTVAGGALDQIGLGFRPFHRSSERPGAFHLVGVHAGPMGFVSDLPRLWSGRGFRDAVAIQAVAPFAILRSSKPIRFMIDGDLYESHEREVEVSSGPVVSFLV